MSSEPKPLAFRIVPADEARARFCYLPVDGGLLCLRKRDHEGDCETPQHSPRPAPRE